MLLPERLAGAVWGHLVGDAVGVPYEFLSPDRIGEVVFGAPGGWGVPPGTWSDDGSLMLALLDSLLRDRAADEPRFDPTDQGARFLRWADHGAYTPDGDGRFDIGTTTSAALSRLRSGTAAEEAGGTDAHSNGNGSLMRILPLALVERDVSDEVVVEHARRSSSITHGHPIARTACALYVLVARRLLSGMDPATALTDATVMLRRILGAGAEPGHSIAALDVIEGWTERSGSGYVVDSLWSAWDAFAGAGSYRETVDRAIRYGNDTDTTAAIAGGLAGSFWGIDGIPRDWLARMRGREVVDPLVDRLRSGLDS
jgi:ADP-ribosyl-[dinitrogen reductase] hydrolase